MTGTYFPSDRDFARVIIEDVTDQFTLCLDFKTGNERKVATAAPGGILPIVGDIWCLTKENGVWELLRCLDRNVDSHARSMAEVLLTLERSGLIRWRPDEADDVVSQHGTAYIGEVRYFAGSIAPLGWLHCNGSTVPISMWRRLYRKIGIAYGGDGITTFGLPNYGSLDAAPSLYTVGATTTSIDVAPAEEVIATLNIPAQPRAGTVLINAHCRVDRSVAADVVRVRLRADSVTGGLITEWYVQANTNSIYTTNLSGITSVSANTARTVVMSIYHESGTGTVTGQGNPYSQMQATVFPTPSTAFGHWRICAD